MPRSIPNRKMRRVLHFYSSKKHCNFSAWRTSVEMMRKYKSWLFKFAKKIHFLPDSGFGLLLPSLRNFQRKQLQHQLNDNQRSQVVKIDYLQIVWVHLGILEHQLSLNESILICLWMCIFVSSVFKWSILGLFFVIFDLFEQTI